MSLLDKLSGAEEPQLPIHQFWSGMTEWAAGEVTKSELMAEFNLQAGTSDETELDWLKGQYDGSANKANFLHYIHSLFILAAQGHFNYNDKTTIQNRISRIP